MIECVKIEDVLTCIIFQVVGKDLTCGELKRIVENLPKIKIEEGDTFESLIDKMHPIGSYYFNECNPTINPNDAFDNTTWECYGRYWIRVE